MLALLLVILCSTSIEFVLKFSELRSNNRAVVTSSNYFFAFIVSAIMFIFSDESRELITFEKMNDLAQFTDLIQGNLTKLHGSAAISYAILLGSLLGFSYFFGLILRQKSIHENGVAITSSFSKLNILVPMVLSFVFWHEFPDTLQSLGVVLFMGAILVSSFNKKKILQLGHLGGTLVLLFLVTGFSGFINKLFQKYAMLEYRSFYLMIVFIVAFVISLFLALKKGEKPKPIEFISGLFVGIPNMFRSYFMILALSQVSTSVAFSVTGAGSIIATTFGAHFIFKEEIKKKDKIAICFIAVALVLVNVTR